MKYAIVSSGGKQYVAREGETIEVDRLPDAVGKKVKFDQVLLAVDGSEIAVGKPTVKGAVVEAKVTAEVKGPKIVVFKYIPKERYRRKQGHRQLYTRVEIKSIDMPSKPKQAAESKEAPAKAEAPAKSEKPAAKTTKKAETSKKKASTKTTAAKATTAKKTTAKPTTTTSKSSKSGTGSSSKTGSTKKSGSTKKE
jgi:large subunit ribosomal protein L21